ncbi:MAG: amidohydrolase family protein [Patescibacteria group bacterium]
MDILIKNGTVIDGNDKKPFPADVGIKNNTISYVGPHLSKNAKVTIDAAGLYVCPGFIDITNHSDTHWTLFNIPSQESMLRQGITSIIGGSCGSSLAPVLHGTVSAESVQKWTDTSEINVNWLSMKEYLEELERHTLGVHYGTLVGHGTLRRNIMEDTVRPANAEEIGRMGYLLDQALTEHAFGLSLGLTFSHGRPATDEELTELAKITAAKDHLLTIHLRDEGKDLLPSITEVLRITRASKVRAHIVHMKAIGRESWEFLTRALQLIRGGREEGLDITISTFPYTRTGSLLYALLPASTRDGGKKRILQRITDPKQRMLTIENLRSISLHYDRIIIASAKNTPHIAGKSIKELAEKSGMDPEEMLLDTLAVNELAVTIFSETINEKNIEAIYLEPHAYFASDGIGYAIPREPDGQHNLVHPRSFGSTAQFFSEFVKKQSILPWEHAVSKMTKAPAELLRLKNRGVLKEGNQADIAIIDPEKIKDIATYTNPFQYPEGIPWVIINGKIAVENGEFTDARAGEILKG